MEISAVLLIGLFADIFNTWLTNVGILKWYVLKGGGK
jgi:preprotein translocase subunit SecF